MPQRWVGKRMLRLTLISGLFAALLIGPAGCASGPGTAVKSKSEPARVLNPGSVSVATNGTMPVLRVEAFRSEERTP